jgi:hypothetical protein
VRRTEDRRSFVRRAALAGAGALLSGCRNSDGAPPAEQARAAATAAPAAPAGTGLDIRDFGATPDGDARGPIQAATDAAARGDGNGVVRIPAGTWTFRSKDARHRLITPPSDAPVTYRGDAGGSVLTVSDGMDEWDGFRTDGGGVLVFEDLVFDGNGAHNLQPRGAVRLQSWIYLEPGRRLEVRRVHFRNHAGARCISVNGADDVVLDQVSARNVGSALAGNGHLGDHSTVWILARRSAIAGCSVDNDRHGDFDTFIESHAPASTVRDNRIRNVRIGIIVAALFDDQIGTLYADNVMEEVGSGYRFYVENGRTMDVTVQGGRVRRRGGAYPVFDTGYCVDPADRIVFRDVHAEQQSGAGDAAPAFTIGKVRSLEIEGGTLRDIGGRVLTLSTHRPAGAGIAAVAVRGLTAVDCGASARGEGIGLHAQREGESLRQVTIEGCTFRNTMAGGPMRTAIAGSLDVTGTVAIRDNTFDNVDPGCAWSADARVGRIELDVVADMPSGFDPGRAGVRASTGSRWLDASSGQVWQKRLEPIPNGAAGWVRT